jgi:hypothetical protein
MMIINTGTYLVIVRKIVQLFIVIIFPLLLFGQKIHVAQVIPETGIVSIGEAIPGITKLVTAQSNATYDVQQGNYILKTIQEDLLQPMYTVVKSNNSQVISQISIPPKDDFLDEIFGLTFNSSSDSMFCIYYDYSEDLYQLMEIDSENGQMNTIKELSAFRTILSNDVLLDEINNRLIFKGLDEENGFRIFSIDLSNGETKTKIATPETGNANNGMYNLQLDPLTGNVFGMQWESESSSWIFVTFNYENGDFEILNNTNTLKSLNIHPKLFSIDYINHRYFVKGQNENEEEVLYTFSTDSGAVLNSVLFYSIGNLYTYYSDLEFDNGSGILYVLYVDTNLETTGIADFENNSIDIFPNPGNSFVNIRFYKFLTSVEFKLISSSGKTLKTFQYQHVKEIQISLDNYEPGMYFLKVNSKETIATFPIIKL